MVYITGEGFLCFTSKNLSFLGFICGLGKIAAFSQSIFLIDKVDSKTKLNGRKDIYTFPLLFEFIRDNKFIAFWWPGADALSGWTGGSGANGFKPFGGVLNIEEGGLPYFPFR